MSSRTHDTPVGQVSVRATNPATRRGTPWQERPIARATSCPAGSPSRLPRIRLRSASETIGYPKGSVFRVRRQLGGATGDKAGLVGDDRLHAVAEAELGEDARDVGFHCRFGDHQFGGDLGVGESAGDELQDFEFTPGQDRQLLG
jgi:hypothetical protein